MISSHSPWAKMPRHRHERGYLALVLVGGFVEAGTGARVRAEPGMMIIHQSWEAHQDHFFDQGAIVLNLPNVSDAAAQVGRISDVDLIARTAELDPVEAASLALNDFKGEAISYCDWPDKLAEDLHNDRVDCLGSWARMHSICLPSVSRGFKKAYGVTPKRYRNELRVVRALGCLANWQGSLAALAAAEGFADQAHFSRGVSALTGECPRRLQVKCIQEFRAASL